jgi:activator of HSP90 ATPase
MRKFEYDKETNYDRSNLMFVTFNDYKRNVTECYINMYAMAMKKYAEVQTILWKYKSYTRQYNCEPKINRWCSLMKGLNETLIKEDDKKIIENWYLHNYSDYEYVKFKIDNLEIEEFIINTLCN